MPPSTPPAQLFIQNVLALRDYETGLVRRVDRILQVLFRNITGRLQTDYADITPFELNRIQALYARTDQMIRSAYERIDKIGEKEMLELAGVQSIFAEETIRLEGRAVGVEIDTTRLTSSQLKVIAEAPIEGAKIKEWWDKQSLNTRFMTRQQVQLGLLQGEPTAVISRRLVTASARGDTGVVAVTRQHAATLTRTAITSIAARAQLEAYRKAGITQYRYVATLDDRTTAICQSLDGKVFGVPAERRPVRVPSEAKSELLVKDISKLSSEQMEKLTKDVTKSISRKVDEEAGFSPFEREQSMGQYGNEFTPNTIASFRKGRDPEEIVRWLAIDALARGQEAAVWMRRVPEGTEGAGLGWVVDVAGIADPGRRLGEALEVEVPEAFGVAEELWAGGIADFGDPSSAIDVQRLPGYFKYRSTIEGALRSGFGDKITVYRAMSPSQLEAWRAGDDIPPTGWTLRREVAEAWKNFALNRGKDFVVVQTTIDPNDVIMRGKTEEAEVVVDSNAISGHTLRAAGAARPAGDGYRRFAELIKNDSTFAPLDGSTLIDGRIVLRNFTEKLTDAQYQKLLEQALVALDVPSSALATGHFLGDYLDGKNLVRAAGGSAGEALRILSAETAPHLREINRILGNTEAEFEKRLEAYINDHLPPGFDDLAVPDASLVGQPEYVYYGTTPTEAATIAHAGLIARSPSFNPLTQKFSSAKRIFFRENPAELPITHTAILRVLRDDMELSSLAGEVFSKKDVPPGKIEVLQGGGWGWDSLVAAAQATKTEPSPIDKDEESPLPPQHINCRSKIVPVMDFEALGLKDPGKIVGRTRASQTGPTKARDYEEWLKGQTEEIQNNALGTGKAQLWRDGKVTLAELVKSDGTAITLTELRERLGIRPDGTVAGSDVDRSGPVDLGGGLMSASRPEVIAWMQGEMKRGDSARVLDKLLDDHEWVRDNTNALILADQRGEAFHHHRVGGDKHDNFTKRLSGLRAEVVRLYLIENGPDIAALNLHGSTPERFRNLSQVTRDTGLAYRRLMAGWGGSATSDSGALLKVMADDWYGSEGVRTMFGMQWIDEDDDLRQEFLLKDAERLWMDEENYTAFWGTIGVHQSAARTTIRQAMHHFILEGYTDVEAWEAVSTIMRLHHETGIAFMKNMGVETFTTFRGSDGSYWGQLGESVPGLGDGGTMAYNSVASFTARESMALHFGSMTVKTTVPIEDYFAGWLTDDVLANEAEILQIGRPRPYEVVRFDGEVPFDSEAAKKDLTVVVNEHLAIANAPEGWDHQGIIQDLSDQTELTVKDKTRILMFPLPKDFWTEDDENVAPGLNFVVRLWATDPLALNAFTLWSTKFEGWASPNISIASGGHKHYLDFARFVIWLFSEANKVKFGQNTEMARTSKQNLSSIGLSPQQATDLAGRLIAEQKRAFYALALSDTGSATFWYDDWLTLDKAYGQHFATYQTNQPESFT